MDLGAATLDLRPFERRPQEVLLKKDVLDRQLINVDGARLVRANDIEIAASTAGSASSASTRACAGSRAVSSRDASANRSRRIEFLDWASVEPFTGHVPTVRLRVPHPKLARLHPAQLADLVEAASHREGQEIMQAVGDDEELEADVFEELDPQHQREFIAERADGEVVAVLARMEADDAVDLLGELDEERRQRIVELLPALQRRRVRALVGYDPATAGGLMSPEFICLYSTATKEEAIGRIRRSPAAADSLTWIYVMNQDRRLKAAISIIDLIRADDGSVLGDVATFMPPTLVTGAEVEEIARVMTDYDLTVVPVIDERQQVMGVVTVDDVLEMMLPRGWRRRFDVLGGE